MSNVVLSFVTPITLAAFLIVGATSCGREESQLTAQEQRVADRWNSCVTQQREKADRAGILMDMAEVKSVCSEYANSPAPTDRYNEVPVTTMATSPAPATDELSYKIIETRKNPVLGSCRVDVRIPHEVTKDDLRQLGTSIKQLYCSTFSTVGIFYWLPGMQVGAGAWATTRYDPDLDIRVFGLPPDKKKPFVDAAKAEPGEELIGRWQMDTPVMVMMIIRHGDKYFLAMTSDPTKYKPSREELTLVESGGKRKFVIAKNNDLGEYYIIDGNGNLRMYDREGFISTARKM